MPRPTLLIEFPHSSGRDFIHRMRNFGEALLFAMQKNDLGRVGDLDTATDRLVVTLSSARHRREVRELIVKVLLAHFLDKDAVISG